MRRFGIAGLLLVLLGAGLFLWLRAETRHPPRIPVLMYHKIGDAVDSPWWVRARDFDEQLRTLREQGYTSILPSRLAAYRRWGRPLPAKPCIITFDDGYLNCLEVAEPLLKRHGFTAVCYLITGAVADAPADRQTREGAPILTWPEVRAMARRGVVAFGGHTRGHANLRALGPRAAEEIESCYRDLRKKGGFEPEGFCYPFGQFADGTPALVRKAGFTTAVTCEDGFVETARAPDLFRLPRLAVMGGWHEFAVGPARREAGRLTVTLAKQSRHLSLVPVLVGRDGQGRPVSSAGAAPVRFSAEPVTVGFEVPAAVAPGAWVLELWDAFRVLRYYRGPLEEGAGAP
jgi:peptidoglycan/xylan/chitin deacetylase (PgdA/CDA1 family)